MNTKNFEILKYSDKYREQILDIWEKSVIATHDFLKATDFQSIKEIVKKIDFNVFEVYCLAYKSEVIGFIGVVEQKIEMLLLSPTHIDKGFGKKLLEFAINKLKAYKVDVNEQNTNAVKFYEKNRFETYERTDQDDQGNDYPLLRMKISKPT